MTVAVRLVHHPEKVNAEIQNVKAIYFDAPGDVWPFATCRIETPRGDEGIFATEDISSIQITGEQR